jgi:hypothetical protein
MRCPVPEPKRVEELVKDKKRIKKLRRSVAFMIGSPVLSGAVKTHQLSVRNGLAGSPSLLVKFGIARLVNA